MKKQMLYGLDSAFAIYQEPDVLDIYAKHKRVSVLNLDGLHLLAKKRPFIGYMGGFLSGPELYGPLGKWHDALFSLNLSHLLIQTNEKYPEFESHRLSPDDNYNIIIDIRKGLDQVLKTFQKKKRQSIKKELKKNRLQVRPAKNKTELKCLYQIIWKNSRQGRLFEVESFDFLNDLMSSRFGKNFLALHNDTLVGGAFLLHHQGVISALSGGFKREYGYLNIWDILHYHIIKWGISRGYSFYDLGHQSLSQAPHLIHYKMRFSPCLLPANIYNVPISAGKAKLTDEFNRLSSKFRNCFAR